MKCEIVKRVKIAIALALGIALAEIGRAHV